MTSCGVFLSRRPCGAKYFAGAGAAALAVLLAAAPAQAAPPVFTSLEAGQPSLFPGQSTVVTASVTDSDPIETWAWTTNRGTISGSGSSVTFTAPAAPRIATVTCTVTDSTGATASRSVTITASDVFPERILSGGLRTPVRVSISRSGEIYVADPSLGGIAVTGLFAPGIHRFLELAGARSVAVDWNDGIAVAGDPGAAVYTSRGAYRFALDPGPALGGANDVAVDAVARRYAVLWGNAGRVVVFDEAGSLLFAFGQAGEAAGQLKGATSVAFTPSGDILVGDSGHGNIKLFSGADGSFLSRTYGRPTGGMGGLTADRFSALAGIATGPDGKVFGADAFYSRFSSFDPAGTVLEAVGSYGDAVGQLRTPTGIAVSPVFRRVVVASVNSSRLDVFRMDGLGTSMALLAVSTTDVAFGTSFVGTLLAGQEVVLTSAGTAPVSLSGLVPSGDFSVVSSTCGTLLAPGASCTIILGFRPSAVGARTGTLTIGNDSQVSPQLVTLSGIGALAPSAILGITGPGAFGDQAVGTASPVRTFSITNSGTGSTGSLVVGVSGPNAGDFVIVSNGCSAPLAPGASCPVDVSFRPATAGGRAASLDVNDTLAPVSSASTPLSGNGVAAAATDIPGLTWRGLAAFALALAAAGALAAGRRCP